ncbi:hypothetical protein [Leucobacter sp. GX24907]
MFHLSRFAGDPAPVFGGFRDSLATFRGIRFADGPGGAAPAGGDGGQQPADGENPSAPTPAQVAAFYAGQNSGQAPAQPQAPAPQAAPSVQRLQGFTPEQMQKAMADAEAAAKDAQDALTAAQKERDEFQAQVTQFQRESAVRTAAGADANADLLLDSAKFQTAIKDINLTDAAALKAAVEKFTTDNPAYKTTPQIPGSSGGTPSGGTTTKPKTLEGAIAARLGG